MVHDIKNCIVVAKKCTVPAENSVTPSHLTPSTGP